MEKSCKWDFSGFDLGSFTFSYAYQSFTKITDNDAIVVLFTDDIIIMETNTNQGGLQTSLSKTLSDIISWFKANFLLLNCNKMYYLQFQN